MQRQYRVLDPFAETIESDPIPVSNNTGMSQRSSMNSFLNPVENRLSNNPSSYEEASCVNAVNNNSQSFSGWNPGESSARLSLQNPETDDGVKMEERWASERRYEQNDIFLPGRASIRSSPSFSHGSSSNCNNISPNLGYLGESSTGRNSPFGPNQFNSLGFEIEQASTSFSADVGPSGSSSYLMEETGGDPGGWGLSCKRKALEGTQGHSCPSGSSSSSSFPPQAENIGWNASSGLSLSPPSRNSPIVSPPELLNTRIGLGMRGLASDNLDSVRNSGGRRLNAANQQESVPFNLSSGSSRRSNAWSVPHSIPAPNSNTSQGPLHGIQASSRRIPFPWNGPSSSRTGNPSSSFIPGERGGTSFRDEINSRSVSRNSSDIPMFVPITEMRYPGQDPSGWSLGTGNPGPSAGVSSSRISPSSSIHPLPTTPTWFPHHNHPTPPNQPRFSEFPPWSLFPSMDSELAGHNGHFPPLSSGSSQEMGMSSGSSGQGQSQQIPRAGFLMEGQGDDILGTPPSLRALAADIEGRHRLLSEIRQVLNAMRRGENLRFEDYAFFDPFVQHGMAELHDRHRDMRLDVDNMSYEELLALGERIGDVNTGLPEATILKLMKQTRYFSIATDSRIDVEPCSICQDEYKNGDELGKLECGHDFHTHCIKQWLMLKNLCPICKTTALPT